VIREYEAMRQRAVEILFRHKFLLLLPFLVILPLTTAFALRPQAKQWQSVAGVWVDPPAQLFNDNRLGSTPAINQSQLLNDFIHTRSFAETVLQQTDLAPLLANPTTADAVVKRFQRSVQATASGNSFVRVAVTYPDPDLAYQMAHGIIQNFQTLLQKQNDSKASTAVSLQSDALNAASTQLDKSRKALADYIAQHPEVNQKQADTVLPASETDPQFAALSAQVSVDSQSYTQALGGYQQAQQVAAAGASGLPFTFTVVDQPQQPIAALTQSRTSQIKLPVIGLVLALLLAGLTAAYLILTDRRVRSVHDLELLGVPVLGAIPRLRRKRWFWQRRPREAVRLRLSAPGRLSPPPN
jgi:uncharacterized protein involved in exopolysaccharide biosynthesis